MQQMQMQQPTGRSLLAAVYCPPLRPLPAHSWLHPPCILRICGARTLFHRSWSLRLDRSVTSDARYFLKPIAPTHRGDEWGCRCAWAADPHIRKKGASTHLALHTAGQCIHTPAHPALDSHLLLPLDINGSCKPIYSNFSQFCHLLLSPIPSTHQLELCSTRKLANLPVFFSKNSPSQTPISGGYSIFCSISSRYA